MLLSPTYFRELDSYLFRSSQNKYVNIPNFFDLEKVECDIRETKENIVLYVGRINDAQKNVMLLPQIWEKFTAINRGWRLVIIGDGPDKNRLIKTFAQRSSNDVEFLDARDPMPYFKKSKIFLMISRYEGFGRTIIEAQHFGCVPIAFNSFSALVHIVNDGIDSTLVRPFDVDKYVIAMSQLISNEAHFDELSKNAMLNSKRFEKQRVLKRWTKLLDEAENVSR